MALTKPCSQCKEDLPLSSFYSDKNQSSGLRPNCIECRKAQAKRYRDKPDAKEEIRLYHINRKYGLSLEDYTTMYENQGGKCLVCTNEFAQDEMVVDHNHSNGEVRGLLCKNCNTGIGMFSEDTSSLLNAVTYLLSFENILERSDYNSTNNSI